MSTFKTSIKLVTRLQDNGDGGYTLHGYNTTDELVADHPSCKNGRVSGAAVLNEHDPYENGYIGYSTIDVCVDTDTQEVTLGKPLHFHSGQ